MDGYSFDKQIGQRLMRLRRDSQQETVNQMKEAGFDVSRELLTKWESGERHIKAEDIAMLARFYNVSCDYLLGLSDAKSPDITVQAICQYLGISEDAVANICKINFSLRKIEERTTLATDKNCMDAINAFISSRDFFKFADAIGWLFNRIEQGEIVSKQYADFIKNNSALNDMEFAKFRIYQTATEIAETFYENTKNKLMSNMESALQEGE